MDFYKYIQKLNKSIFCTKRNIAVVPPPTTTAVDGSIQTPGRWNPLSLFPGPYDVTDRTLSRGCDGRGRGFVEEGVAW
jgi:hypothetical protein